MGQAYDVCNAFVSSATPYSTPPTKPGRDPGGDYTEQHYGKPFGSAVSASHDACMAYCSDVLTLNSNVNPGNYGLTNPAAQCR